MAEEKNFPMFCPRCDREYDSHKSEDATLEIVKNHVSKQHPDHDPEWYETGEVI